jgi:dTDP-4-amino-4,6-dideoxygalactose transaminase
MSIGDLLTTKNLIVDDDEIAAVIEVLRSGDLSGNSATVASYEAALRGFFGSAHAIACSSGTAAIHLALLSLGVGRGHEVILPATAPAMTALAVVATGAQPVFADVGSTSFALDLDDVVAKTNPATRAAISVPMWGYPADGELLAALCADTGLGLIEDAAQAHGTMVDGRIAGTRGAIGAFSTHTRKMVSTGEGGFCLTDDDELADRLRQARNLGQPAAGGLFGSSLGLNYKLAALSAGVGIVQIGRLPHRLARRREIWTRLRAGFSGHAGIQPFPVPAGDAPNGYAFLALAEPAVAAALSQALLEEGIASDTLLYSYAPTYAAPALAAFAGRPCERAERLCQSILALPCHEAVVEDHVGRMIQVVERVAA